MSVLLSIESLTVEYAVGGRTLSAVSDVRRRMACSIVQRCRSRTQ